MQDTPKPTAFYNKTFDETVSLLEETRDYVACGARTERRLWREADGIRMSAELMRVTARLTQVMAWLLVQKAIHAGELRPTEGARGPNRLSGRKVCLDTRMQGDRHIPPVLNNLLDRSYRLYVRVSRLDEMVARAVEADTAPLHPKPEFQL